MNCFYIESILLFVIFPTWNFLLVLYFIILMVIFPDTDCFLCTMKSNLSFSFITFVIGIYYFCWASFLLLQVMNVFRLVENSFYAFSEADLPTLLSGRDTWYLNWPITGLHLPTLGDWFWEAMWPKLNQSASSLRLHLWLLRETNSQVTVSM